MFLSNKPGVPPGINLLQKPSQKPSRPSGNLANPVIFTRKPGEDKDSTGSVTERCLNYAYQFIKVRPYALSLKRIRRPPIFISFLKQVNHYLSTVEV